MKAYKRNPRTITGQGLAELEASLDELGDLGGIVHNLTTDEIVGGNQRMKVFADGHVVVTETFPQPDNQGTVGLGYVVWRGNRYAYRQVRWDERTAAKANIRANIEAGEWDWGILATWNPDDLNDWGFGEGLLERRSAEAAGLDMLLATFRGGTGIMDTGIQQALEAYTGAPLRNSPDAAGAYDGLGDEDEDEGDDGGVPGVQRPAAPRPDFFDATKVEGASDTGASKKTYLLYTAFPDEDMFYAALALLTFGERSERRPGMTYAAIDGVKYIERWIALLSGGGDAATQ